MKGGLHPVQLEDGGDVGYYLIDSHGGDLNLQGRPESSGTLLRLPP